MKRTFTTINGSDEPETKVALIDRNVIPQRLPLVDPKAAAKPFENDLIELATEIQKAGEFVQGNTYGKLKVIVDQIKFLMKQAEDVLMQAEWNMKLHQAACNFVRKPGHVYHLYQRGSGEYYFSMLSPEEWGSSGPSQSYEGSYRLEQDRSWTELNDTDKTDKSMEMLVKHFSNNPTIATAFKSININLDTFQ